MSGEGDAGASRGYDINERYSRKSDLEHVLLRPDTYVGGTDKIVRDEWVFDEGTSRVVRKQVEFSPALYKIFDEVLVNARDHTERSEACTRIRIAIADGSITVENNGPGIPVEEHNEGFWLPELIFGVFKTGENFADEEQKVVGGRNGFGAKLANAFSAAFTVDTVDAVTRKRYVQTWRENMSVRGEPEITSCRKAPYTRVTFTPDYARLGGSTGLESDVRSLLIRRVYDLAACTRPQVLLYLNDAKLSVRTFERYMNLYLGDSKTAVPRVYQVLENALPADATPRIPSDCVWELGVALSDDGFQHVSFVNGIATPDGGTHVDYVRNQLVRKLVKLIQERNPKSTVKASHVREGLWLFLNAVVVNPAFGSQTKGALTTKTTSFGFKHTVSTELVELVEKRLGIGKRATGLAELQKPSALKGTDGKKRKRLHGILKLEDAKQAGGRRSAECTLILTEGDSAKTTAMNGLQVVGQEFFGVYPLRGKVVNVRNVAPEELAKNAEYVALKQIIGLQEGVEYTDASQLRYGKLLVMTDQDLDGFHIKGLLANLFLSQWPSLMALPGFFSCFVTPIIRVQIRAGAARPEERLFFNMSEFEAYRDANAALVERKTTRVRYLKGLGSSEPHEARQYFREFARFVKQYHVGSLEACIELFDRAFGKAHVTWRKQWLQHYDPDVVYDYRQPRFELEQFVDCELKHFSVYDNVRSIAHVMDGFKVSQRKVLWAMRAQNVWSVAKKVAAAASDVAGPSSYHHSETSLMDTIIGMAQTFAGSNNVNFLYPSGQFGSRIGNGKDASAARYIHTYLHPITRLVFRAEDDPVLRYARDDEGRAIEPTYFVPVVPTVLLNGCTGIGTGYRTEVPQFHPLHVLDASLAACEEREVPELTPWYRGYAGRVEPSGPNKWTMHGVWERLGPKRFRITEIPLTRSFDAYKEFLEKHLVDHLPSEPKPKDRAKYFVKDHDERLLPTSCTFDVQTVDPLSDADVEKKLHLVAPINACNMNLYNTENAIQLYASVADIVRAHAARRLEVYALRKQHALRKMQDDIELLEQKMRFIQLVVDGELELRNRRKDDVVADLAARGVTDDPARAESLLGIALMSITRERIRALRDRIVMVRCEYDELRETDERSLWRRELMELRVELERMLERVELDDPPPPRKKKRKARKG